MISVSLPTCFSVLIIASVMRDVTTNSIFNDDHLVCGQRHSCRIKNDGVVCFGWNDQGQLGQGNTENIGDEYRADAPLVSSIDFGEDSPAPSDVQTGYKHTCALFDDSAVSNAFNMKCWGRSDEGQLGNGSVKPIGDNEEINKQPYLSFGSGIAVQSMCLGQAHTCAILSNGKTICWGANEYGQLGQGDTMFRGTNNYLIRNINGINFGGDRHAEEIFCGPKNSCARLTDGNIKCWGWNSFHQLGIIDDAASTYGDENQPYAWNDSFGGAQPEQVALGGFHTCVLFESGDCKCFGNNIYGQLGVGDNRERSYQQLGDFVQLGGDAKVAKLCTGRYHSCALLDSGRVKCWGSNSHGQLGTGAFGHVGTSDLPSVHQPIDLGTGDSTAINLACGEYFTCVTLEQSRFVKCFGSNSEGELGIGNRLSVGNTANMHEYPALALYMPPSPAPSASPSEAPSETPSAAPTSSPSLFPTFFGQTKRPTQKPTTSSPSAFPTARPTASPSVFPTRRPTTSPTAFPSRAPSTEAPTERPTNPTPRTTTQFPTSYPTMHPSKFPTRLSEESDVGAVSLSESPSAASTVIEVQEPEFFFSFTFHNKYDGAIHGTPQFSDEICILIATSYELQCGETLFMEDVTQNAESQLVVLYSITGDTHTVLAWPEEMKIIAVHDALKRSPDRDFSELDLINTVDAKWSAWAVILTIVGVLWFCCTFCWWLCYSPLEEDFGRHVTYV